MYIIYIWILHIYILYTRPSSPSLITTTSSNLRLGISHDALEADHTDLTLRAEEALAGHEAGQAAGGVGHQQTKGAGNLLKIRIPPLGWAWWGK